MDAKVWPPFQATDITKSSSEDYNMPCPYIVCKKILGSGSYSHVFECKNVVTGAHFACKQYSKKLVYGLELMLQSEFKVLKAVLNGHKNILLMWDYFETSKDFYLVTDLALGGELFDRITSSEKLEVNECRDILTTLLSTLAYLHSNGIVHRDIKAENLLFTSRSSMASLMLLADFGHAKILHSSEEKVLELSGTLSYLAPEVLSREGHGFPVDMWAVGVLTYFMLSGYMPFDCDTDDETKELINTADFVFEPPAYWADVPLEAREFISRCFTLDPSKRITAAEGLKHPFLMESNPLKHSLSSANSFQKLHDAVWKFHMQKSHTNIAEAFLPRYESVSSYASRLSMDTPVCTPILLGERCYSPETVTTFTTPVVSAAASRQHSLNSLHAQKAMHLAPPGKMSKANFVI